SALLSAANTQQTHRSNCTEEPWSSTDASARELSASTQPKARSASPDIRESRQDKWMAWLVQQTGSLLGAVVTGSAD
ncbi:hypothetical protein JOQ06_005428, partial [Pogonophryne albipinna]